MDDVDHISAAVQSVSLHLEAVRLLADTLSTVIDDGGTARYQYSFCLAFELLAEAAQSKLDSVHDGVAKLSPLKRDMDAVALCAAHA